jgi:hypothetical protein
MVEFDERLLSDDELMHYGILRRSGRYPWGSGVTPMQRNRSFLGYVDDLKSQGFTDTQIAKYYDMSTSELRAAKSIAKTAARQADATRALKLKDKGWSNVAIGREMGINESSVRNLLNPALTERRSILENTAKLLKDEVDKGGYLDVGSGNENHLGISSTKLSTALAMLKEQDYQVRNIQVPQLFGKGNTTVKTLVPPGAPKFIDPAQIKTIAAYSEDRGRSFRPIIQPPVPVSSSRVGVRHFEQGGGNADGVIYVRPGVPDISLGASRYAQVRIAVDGTHYLKGMAMYNDHLPEGVDLLFNTSKHDTGNKMDAMKPVKGDELNPFGSMFRQRNYIGADGKSHLSPMNIVNEERPPSGKGDWRDWRPSLSSQILSKQNTKLAEQQLGLTYKMKQQEFEEIMSLTNPVVKRKLLQAFADSADSAAVHLSAAALPRQGTHVILPIQSIKENEIYAPKYRNGETVALIRHPHGGIFEIPELKVNNRNREARATIGPEALDAVGIHPKVSKLLSGADFDGDAVLVIPNNRRTLRTAPPLAGLKNFDPQTHYPPFHGMKTIDGGTYNAKTGKVDYPNGATHGSGRSKQQKMGDVSNLITDMTIKDAKPDEIAAAVRHSMVVIDAEKHSLDYKRSYEENGIPSLKAKYQGYVVDKKTNLPTKRLAGASTLISRAGAETRVNVRRPRPASKGGPIDLATGRKVYEPTGASYVNKKGIRVFKTERSTRLAEEADARKLSSGSQMEEVYAAHSNSLKALANQARLESTRTGGLRYSPSARQTYAHEVAALNAALNNAYKNRPLERQAQILANIAVSAKTRDNPHIDSDDLRKLNARELDRARTRIGAKKNEIVISPRQWEAIQAGAITSNKLTQILNNANLDRVKVLATPRAATVMTPTKMAIARSRLASGYTQAEVAASLGIKVSTLNSALLSEGG